MSSATAPLLSLLAHRLTKRRDPGGEGSAAGAGGGWEGGVEAACGAGVSRWKSLLKLFRHNLAAVRAATIDILAQVSLCVCEIVCVLI